LKAEKKAREEEEKRKKEEEIRKKAEREALVSNEQNRYLIATSNTSEEVKDLIHTINISSGEISASLTKIYQILKEEDITSNELIEQIEALKFNSDKIELLGSMITKADLNLLKEKKAIDIPLFAKEYIQSHQKGSKIKFSVENNVNSFKVMLNLLDIYLIFDNLISNSKKSNATAIQLDINQKDNKLFIDFSDNGDGLSSEFINNQDNIFKIGITDKPGGSGIGLYTIKKTMQDDLHGDIFFKGNSLAFKSGATFTLIFKR
jgi:signal transduction histidine kinase